MSKFCYIKDHSVCGQLTSFSTTEQNFSSLKSSNCSRKVTVITELKDSKGKKQPYKDLIMKGKRKHYPMGAKERMLSEPTIAQGPWTLLREMQYSSSTKRWKTLGWGTK